MRVAGIDLGLVRNASAFIALEGDEDRVKVIHEKLWKPGRVTLKLGQVLPAISLRCVSLEVERMGYDQHYAQSVVEHFEEEKIPVELIRTPTPISPLYVELRKWLENDRIDLSGDADYKPSDRLKAELERVSYHFGSSGTLLIDLPTMPDGSHCDLVSALIAGFAAFSRGLTGRVFGEGKRKLAPLAASRYGNNSPRTFVWNSRDAESED